MRRERLIDQYDICVRLTKEWKYNLSDDFAYRLETPASSEASRMEREAEFLADF